MFIMSESALLVNLCVSLMGNYSSVLIPDTEEYESIVSLVTEKPNEPSSLLSELQTLVNMEPERGINQCVVEDSSKDTSDTSSIATSKAEPSTSSSGEPLSSLLPKALSAVLHQTLPPGHSRNPPSSENATTNASPPNLEQLQNELTVLRGQFEQMKAQHNKEIKLLMNELDEEKRIRLTLQMEIKRIKKHMPK